MTKKNLSDLIRLRLGMASQDAKADHRTLEWLADVVRERLIAEWMRKNNTSDISSFVKGLVFKIEKDTVRSKKFIDISNSILELPNGSILSCSKVESDHLPFIPARAGQSAVMNGLEANSAGTEWSQEGGRVYFRGIGFEVEEVLVLCVPAITKLENNEHIPMPAIKDEVIEGVVEKVINQMPEDRSGDQRQDK